VASLVGVAAFVEGQFEEKEQYGWSAVAYSIFMCFWASFFIAFWKRRNSVLAFSYAILFIFI